jgi:hypothetical protein
MSYGTLKVDNITYTNGGVDASTSVSGLVGGQFPNISITGTISGATITGNTGSFGTITAVTGIFTSTLSGQTTTGVTANFQSGVFTTQISGAIVAGPTHTGTTANFESGVFTTRVSGATVTGNAGQFTNITGGGAAFTSVTGTTITGTTVNAVSANFTNTVTGTTFSGATVNAGSANFTTSVTGAIVAGPTHTGTTANFSSGNFTGTLSGNTVRDNAGNVRDIPQVVQTTSYTLAATDAGDHIFTTAGVTVPSGVFSVGQAVTIYNNTAGTITITQGTNVTLRQAGASGTGNRTLAQRGLATVLCVSGASGTEFVIAGNIT